MNENKGAKVQLHSAFGRSANHGNRYGMLAGMSETSDERNDPIWNSGG